MNVKEVNKASSLANEYSALVSEHSKLLRFGNKGICYFGISEEPYSFYRFGCDLDKDLFEIALIEQTRRIRVKLLEMGVNV